MRPRSRRVVAVPELQMMMPFTPQKNFHEPSAAAGTVELKPPLKVLGEAQVMPRMLVGALEVEQVLGRHLRYADLRAGTLVGCGEGCDSLGLNGRPVRLPGSTGSPAARGGAPGSAGRSGSRVGVSRSR